MAALGETEAVYRVHLICVPEKVSEARDLLAEELELHHYPIREMETLSEREYTVELVAELVPINANPAELDANANHLERHVEVISATWMVSTEN